MMSDAREGSGGATGGEVISLWGDVLMVRVRGEETAGQVAMLELVTAPGSGVSLHAHPNADETFYVLEGSLAFQIAHQKVQAGPGSVVFAPRGVRHTFVNTGSTPARTLILITPAGLEQFFEALGEMAKEHPLGPPNKEFFALARKHNVELL